MCAQRETIHLSFAGSLLNIIMFVVIVGNVFLLYTTTKTIYKKIVYKK